MTEREHQMAAQNGTMATEGEEPSLTSHELDVMIESICNSKAEEFRMLGYEQIQGKDIWDCVSSKYKETPPLHRVVNDILSLKTTQLMNWMTLSAWKMS